MGNKASTTDIVTFLQKVKRLITTGKYDFVPRRKNMQALAQHGLTITDAKFEILELVVGDYYKGPKQDLDPNRPGDVWEFKKGCRWNSVLCKSKDSTGKWRRYFEMSRVS